MTGVADYRSVSLWLDTLDEAIVPRPALRDELTADVVIVGAGQARAYLARGSWDGVQRGERAMTQAIDYVGDVVRQEAIDCGWTKSGALRIATTPAQLDRVRAGVERRRQGGLAESDVRFLSAAELTDRVRIARVVGGTYTPHCARVHPGPLVRGLAAACERRGVRIFERSPVASIDPGRVRCAPTDRGAPMDGSPRVGVRARVVVQATEAFTVNLPGHRRDYMPVFSHMVATEPLDEATWAAIGWERCEPVADQRHLFTYGQRTIDGRIHAELERALRAWFPAAADAAISHRWGAVFAVPRDWSMSIAFDRATGLARAGGLAGHGVIASSLCGRTLTDLILHAVSPS